MLANSLHLHVIFHKSYFIIQSCLIILQFVLSPDYFHLYSTLKLTKIAAKLSHFWWSCWKLLHLLIHQYKWCLSYLCFLGMVFWFIAKASVFYNYSVRKDLTVLILIMLSDFWVLLFCCFLLYGLFCHYHKLNDLCTCFNKCITDYTSWEITWNSNSFTFGHLIWFLTIAPTWT